MSMHLRHSSPRPSIQLGCSESIFAFLLEPFSARDRGWTVAAGSAGAFGWKIPVGPQLRVPHPPPLRTTHSLGVHPRKWNFHASFLL